MLLADAFSINVAAGGEGKTKRGRYKTDQTAIALTKKVVYFRRYKKGGEVMPLVKSAL